MNNKKTVFFWLGIVAAVLLLAYVGYGIAAYNNQIDYYVTYYQGSYTEEMVRESIPFLSFYIPDRSADTILLLILTVILFAADALVAKLEDFLNIFELAVFDDCCCEDDCECEEHTDCDCEDCKEESPQDTKEEVTEEAEAETETETETEKTEE